MSPVEMNGDGCTWAGVPYPVDPALVRQDGRCSVLPAPHPPPNLPQAGAVRLEAVVEALVTLFYYRSDNAAQSSPRGMVVDLGLGTRRPDEDLHGEEAVIAGVGAGHVPLLGPVCLLQEREDLGAPERRVLHQAFQDWNDLLQGQRRREGTKLLQFAQFWYERRHHNRLTF